MFSCDIVAESWTLKSHTQLFSSDNGTSMSQYREITLQSLWYDLGIQDNMRAHPVRYRQENTEYRAIWN